MNDFDDIVRNELVSVKRLAEIYLHNKDSFSWTGQTPISINEILDAVNDESKTISLDQYFKEDQKPKDNEWHLSRIKFFVLNHQEIKDIDVENEKVIEGNHRFMAALARGDKLIGIRYTGAQSILDYLTGTSDRNPIN